MFAIVTSDKLVKLKVMSLQKLWSLLSADIHKSLKPRARFLLDEVSFFIRYLLIY